jgi:hypothetical protein
MRRQYPRQRFIDYRHRFGANSIARREHTPFAQSNAYLFESALSKMASGTWGMGAYFGS